MKCAKLARYERELQACLSNASRSNEADAMSAKIKDHKVSHSSNLSVKCD